MAQINLSAWAIRHSTLMHFFMLLVALAGVHAYFALGQDEDPPFTVRTMVVRAYLPGATIDETMRELTDRIEKKLEEMGQGLVDALGGIFSDTEKKADEAVEAVEEAAEAVEDVTE